MPRNFPQGFLWGTAISGFQVEMGGGIQDIDANSDWFIWVHDRLNIERGMVSGDLPENGPSLFKLFKEEINRAKEELCHNSIRLSLEWSRIFPNPTFAVNAEVTFDNYGMLAGVKIGEDSMEALNEFADQKAMEKYREILKYIGDKGMFPLVTLNHFTLPYWLP